MTPFEKLLMIMIPSFGLAAILAFFNFYAPDVVNNSLYEQQRLQGNQTYNKTITSPVKSKNNYSFKKNNQNQNKVNNYKKIAKKDYLQWSGHESITYMPKSLKNKKYTVSNDSYYPPTSRPHKILSYVPKQQTSNKFVKTTKEHIKKKCEYILKRKKQIKETMNRGYKASEYNYLESDRKYWAKKYSDNCFNR